MKCQLLSNSRLPNHVRIEFDRIIPRLHLEKPRPFGETSGEFKRLLQWGGPKERQRQATRIARLNAGKVPFELANPVKAYSDLLERLSTLEGLVAINDACRYRLTFEVGSLFKTTEVARQLASLLQESFYPDDEIEWGAGFETADTEDGKASFPSTADSHAASGTTSQTA